MANEWYVLIALSLLVITKVIFLGYVDSSDTAWLPPIADPECFLSFAQTHVANARTSDWQTNETYGDKIYNSCIHELLTRLPIPGACFCLLSGLLTTNQYQIHLCQKLNLLDYCLGMKGKDNHESIPNKAQADVLEVSPSFVLHNPNDFLLHILPLIP
jgi:hypothetical protein